MNRLLIALGGAATLLTAGLAAGPVAAGDTACLWSHVPQAKRDGLLAKSATDGPQQAMQSAPITDQEVSAAILACGVKVDTAPAAKSALIGYALDLVIGRWFETHEKTAPAKLEAAWQSLAPDKRDALQRIASNQAQGEPDKATFAAFLTAAGFGAADRPDILSSQSGEYLFIYMMGRALRAASEPKF